MPAFYLPRAAAQALRRRLGVVSGFLAEERDRGQDQEDDEQDPGNAAGSAGNATETEYARDQRNDEEDDGVMQHEELPVVVCRYWRHTYHRQAQVLFM